MTRKQIYLSIGITAVMITAGVIARYRKGIKKKVTEANDKAESWIRPVVAKITSKFGHRTDPKTGKTNAFHNGIDLAVPSGTPVKSPMAGVVESTPSGGAGGNEIIIKHINGYKTGYAHLKEALVKKGYQVKQGDVIALSGNTGKSTGPHLHFTLTGPTGVKVDPEKMIYKTVV